jgi:hypothetical protein
MAENPLEEKINPLEKMVVEDLGVPEDGSARTEQQNAVLALVLGSLHYRNPPKGPAYKHIIALGKRALGADKKSR